MLRSFFSVFLSSARTMTVNLFFFGSLLSSRMEMSATLIMFFCFFRLNSV